MEATKTTAKRYREAVGRRKTSTARVRLTPAAKTSFVINDLDGLAYVRTSDLFSIINEPFVKGKIGDTYEVTVVVSGGGNHSQVEAIRHGISRILSTDDEATRTVLKKLGFLKRDPRMKERRKFGLKKARKAPKWSKR